MNDDLCAGFYLEKRWGVQCIFIGGSWSMASVDVVGTKVVFDDTLVEP